MRTIYINVFPPFMQKWAPITQRFTEAPIKNPSPLSLENSRGWFFFPQQFINFDWRGINMHLKWFIWGLETDYWINLPSGVSAKIVV